MQGQLGIGATGVSFNHRGFEPGAKTGERRSKVVGDGITRVAQTADRSFQPSQHIVQTRREFVILVARAAHRRAGRQIAAARQIDHTGQAGDVAADIATDQQASRQAQHHDQGASPPQSPQDLVHISFGFTDVGADKQDLPAA